MKRKHIDNNNIKLLDVVALTEDVPEHNLKRGEVGTVVEILSNGDAFEVEFSDDNGQMYKCLSFLASQLQVIHDKQKVTNPTEQVNMERLEEYRRAAIRAANLDDWKKAAALFEEGGKKAQQIENTERNIGFYADAGFAHFKAGNISDCIRLLHLALRDFEKRPQDNTDPQYRTLKKSLELSVKYVWAVLCGLENNSSLPYGPPAGICSNPETDEELLHLPVSPIGYSWYYLAQIEYRFGHETTVFQYTLQTTDNDLYPDLRLDLSLLKTKYDFRNRTLNELPARIQEFANIHDSIQKQIQNGKGIGQGGIGLIYNQNVPNHVSVEDITIMLLAALVIQLSEGANTHEILSIWRENSKELPIKENMSTVLNLIDRILSADQNYALRVMKSEDLESGERVTAALKVAHSVKTSPANLFHANVIISIYLVVNLQWLDPCLDGLARLLSSQWLEKIKSRAAFRMQKVTVPEIERACKSTETGKKKIAQILLAVYQAVSVRVAPENLQIIRSWTEIKTEASIRKNMQSR